MGYTSLRRRGTGAFGPKSPSAKQRQALTAQGYRLRDTDDRISREKKDGSSGGTATGASDVSSSAGVLNGAKRGLMPPMKKPQGGPVSYHGEHCFFCHFHVTVTTMINAVTK